MPSTGKRAPSADASGPRELAAIGSEPANRVDGGFCLEVGMTTSDGAKVQSAFDAATRGDIEPLVAMLDPALEWRGRTRGHLWWRTTPS